MPLVLKRQITRRTFLVELVQSQNTATLGAGACSALTRSYFRFPLYRNCAEILIICVLKRGKPGFERVKPQKLWQTIVEVVLTHINSTACQRGNPGFERVKAQTPRFRACNERESRSQRVKVLDCRMYETAPAISCTVRLVIFISDPNWAHPKHISIPIGPQNVLYQDCVNFPFFVEIALLSKTTL